MGHDRRGEPAAQHRLVATLKAITPAPKAA